jgi:predicted transcriptional regulator
MNKLMPTIPHVTAMSDEAHASVKPTKTFIQQQVIDYLRTCGPTGATCDQMEAALGLSHQTCSPRVNELMKAKKILPDPVRRMTRSGRRATVWVLPVFKRS